MAVTKCSCGLSRSKKNATNIEYLLNNTAHISLRKAWFLKCSLSGYDEPLLPIQVTEYGNYLTVVCMLDGADNWKSVKIAFF